MYVYIYIYMLALHVCSMKIKNNYHTAVVEIAVMKVIFSFL